MTSKVKEAGSLSRGRARYRRVTSGYIGKQKDASANVLHLAVGKDRLAGTVNGDRVFGQFSKKFIALKMTHNDELTARSTSAGKRSIKGALETAHHWSDPAEVCPQICLDSLVRLK